MEFSAQRRQQRLLAVFRDVRNFRDQGGIELAGVVERDVFCRCGAGCADSAGQQGCGRQGFQDVAAGQAHDLYWSAPPISGSILRLRNVYRIFRFRVGTRVAAPAWRLREPIGEPPWLIE
jgi:hypothetical protein